ncbi:Protein YcgL [Marinomonas gallaica]|uniref:YcgL domain-containing protein MGA5115_03259 n=1 Tax=Marinomonas gallaica TaxID=1806667 RepID=A0A1C3JV54_9GAMM|nr:MULTISPECIES: YcgL domain-containing protein [Marinomonas]MCO4785521.1 YcgL domain-containing protein [Marinomonas atlantica]SBT19098.1 Protein YcgL [Marinomonas gallaica]SBT20827.1 Protein YcgL [Marinomonas gallaica]
MSHMIIEIFRSSKVDEMYLYVEKNKGLKNIPEALMSRFGAGISAMTMLIKPDQKLARANATDVMESIKEKGFYLQMPPAREEYLLDMYKAPTEARY